MKACSYLLVVRVGVRLAAARRRPAVASGAVDCTACWPTARTRMISWQRRQAGFRIDGAARPGGRLDAAGRLLREPRAGSHAAARHAWRARTCSAAGAVRSPEGIGTVGTALYYDRTVLSLRGPAPLAVGSLHVRRPPADCSDELQTLRSGLPAPASRLGAGIRCSPGAWVSATRMMWWTTHQRWPSCRPCSTSSCTAPSSRTRSALLRGSVAHRRHEGGAQRLHRLRTGAQRAPAMAADRHRRHCLGGGVARAVPRAFAHRPRSVPGRPALLHHPQGGTGFPVRERAGLRAGLSRDSAARFHVRWPRSTTSTTMCAAPAITPATVAAVPFRERRGGAHLGRRIDRHGCSSPTTGRCTRATCCCRKAAREAAASFDITNAPQRDRRSAAAGVAALLAGPAAAAGTGRWTCAGWTPCTTTTASTRGTVPAYLELNAPARPGMPASTLELALGGGTCCTTSIPNTASPRRTRRSPAQRLRQAGVATVVMIAPTVLLCLACVCGLSRPQARAQAWRRPSSS